MSAVSAEALREHAHGPAVLMNSATFKLCLTASSGLQGFNDGPLLAFEDVGAAFGTGCSSRNDRARSFARLGASTSACTGSCKVRRQTSALAGASIGEEASAIGALPKWWEPARGCIHGPRDICRIVVPGVL